MAEKEQTNKSPLNIFKHVINLDNILSGDRRYSLEELTKNFKGELGSRATINRTINFMIDVLHAPILTDENHRYYYANNTFRLPVFFMNEEQMKACFFLKDYIKPLKGTPYYNSINSLMELIQSNTLKSPVGRNYLQMYEEFDYHQPADLNWVNQHYIILGDSRGGVEEDTWNQIEKAIKEHRCIAFDYDWPLSKYSHRHGVGKIAPYQVVCSGNKWYLWGWNYEKDAFQLFMMDRILGVELMYDRFKLPEKFDYRECGSGERHIDLMGRKLIKKTIELETKKSAEELKEECRTSMINFSDESNGKVRAEISCPESSLNLIMERIKELLRPENVKSGSTEKKQEKRK